jgi:signal transduction histidine kinase
VAIALEGGKAPRRLGAYGLLPASVALASDEASLLLALERTGMVTTWSRAFKRDRGAVMLLAFGSRSQAGISVEHDDLLEATAALIDLRLQTMTAAMALENEQRSRKTMEARLVEIERQSTVGTVASAVAHDLSAPISALLMEISELRERVTYLSGFLPETNVMVRNVLEDIRGLVDHCTDSTERARQLLIDFRLAAHPGSSQSLPSAAVNVGDTLRSCVRLLAPLARDKVRIELSIEPELPVIAGTRKRLEQALTNLLVNAIHAASVREGFAGLLEARVRRDGGDIVVEIQDNGSGIAPEVLAHIVEPFFTTKGAEQGTGLGLPIAKDAIEAHGGKIACESQLGRGALFRIHLPITAVPAHAAPSNLRRRLLVVDDDDGVARALERILRSDYEVSVARSGERALELISMKGPFDGLIVDIAMPVMDGPQLYERIRHTYPGLEKKIIFATGGAFTAASRAFLASVPNTRFEKPITREELRPIVQSVVSTSA